MGRAIFLTDSNVGTAQQLDLADHLKLMGNAVGVAVLRQVRNTSGAFGPRHVSSCAYAPNGMARHGFAWMKEDLVVPGKDRNFYTNKQTEPLSHSQTLLVLQTL